MLWRFCVLWSPCHSFVLQETNESLEVLTFEKEKQKMIHALDHIMIYIFTLKVTYRRLKLVEVKFFSRL